MSVQSSVNKALFGVNSIYTLIIYICFRNKPQIYWEGYPECWLWSLSANKLNLFLNLNSNANKSLKSIIMNAIVLIKANKLFHLLLCGSNKIVFKILKVLK